MTTAADMLPLADLLADPPPAPTPEIGWFCSYTPEEIILAAGLTPRRLRGSCHPIRSADTYLHNNLCPYVRSTLDVALHDEDDAVAGVVTVASCDSMRRLHDAWCAELRPQFDFLLSMPRLDTDMAMAFAAEEFRELGAALGTFRGRPITDVALHQAVNDMNRMRAALRDLAALHIEGYREVSAYDLDRAVDAAMRWPKAAFADRLTAWSEDVRAHSLPRPLSGPRLLLSGGILDHGAILELIEELGGNVLYDDLCTGRRYYTTDVDTEVDDVYRAVAARQLGRSPCARMRDTERRARDTVDLCRTYDIDGVIYYTIKFCDPHLYDYVAVEQEVRKAGIPVLRWESDHTLGAQGQMRTRVEAFLEMLR